MQGGDIISKVINYFFITYIINLFITIYSIYSFFDIKIFHNMQGSKLNGSLTVKFKKNLCKH